MTDGPLRFGGDYNPEQWPEHVWDDDIALMRRAGVNLVSVGVFSWSCLEPTEGHYTFDWLDRLLDRLAGAGIDAALATPTASPPPWFSCAYPGGLPVGPDGVRLIHGSRDTYCVSSPDYRRAAARIAGALADRYADHPALALWHVHNEYGTACHCDGATASFRRWLRARYGTLDALNEAWTGAFWSQRYSAWEQIRTPVATRYLHNPTQLLDFRRFTSDELLAAFVEQRDLLRAANPRIPVTTNFVFGNWVPVDHARWAAEVDVVAIDHYPSDAGLVAEEQAAFAGDLARGWAGGGPWLLMESAPNLISAGGRMHTKEPGRMARNSMTHIARGSHGAMFFQWRAPRGGAEMFHSAMVPHAGPDSRVFRETVDLGATLPRIAEATAGTVAARVAIAWDAPSWWALQTPGLPSDAIDYLGEVRAAHRALWRAGIATDLVGLPTDLSRYAMLVLPATYLLTGSTAVTLREFVAGGGHLVVTYLTAIADTDARIHLGGYLAVLADLLGIRVEEFHPLAPDEQMPLAAATPVQAVGPVSAVAPVSAGGPVSVAGADEAVPDGAYGTFWSETVHLAGAEVVIEYAGGLLAGRPAVTRCLPPTASDGEGPAAPGPAAPGPAAPGPAAPGPAAPGPAAPDPAGRGAVGRGAGGPGAGGGRGAGGSAWYVSTRLDAETYRRLLVQIAAEAGIAPVLAGCPAQVEAVRRIGADASWLFLINHGDRAVKVPATGTELVTGVRVDGTLLLAAGAVAVVRQDRTDATALLSSTTAVIHSQCSRSAAIDDIIEPEGERDAGSVSVMPGQ